MDIESNKPELWTPNDIEFEKPGEQIGQRLPNNFKLA